MAYFTLYRLKSNAGNQAQPVRRQELAAQGTLFTDAEAVAETRRTHSVGNLNLLQVYCGDTRRGTRARLVETIVDDGPSWTVCGTTLDGAEVEETYYELRHACVRAQGIQEDGGSAMVMNQDADVVDHWEEGYRLRLVENGANVALELEENIRKV